MVARRFAARGSRLIGPYALWIVAAALLLACQPASSPGAPSRADTEGPPTGPRSLVIAIEGDPGPFVLPTSSRAASQVGELDLAVHQWLVYYDEQGTAQPMLAAELPARERRTWQVNPDGSMQTTYRLRPGVTWHDGHPLTATDFVFGWRVQRDPDLPTSKSVINLSSAMTALDDLTIAIDWRTSYPGAGALAVGEFVPLASHLVEQTYLADKEQFVGLPYWTQEFVGVGPFQIAEYYPGSHMVLRAYPGFYRGAAKLDRVEVRFISGTDSIVVNLLAGTVDGALPGVLDFEGARAVQRQWEGAGKRPLVVIQPESWRHVFVQFREPAVREVLDLRVRRALLQAVDREAISAALTDGLGPISHAPFPASDPRWRWMGEAVVQHQYDPRQAEQLLAEAGLRRGGDGTLARVTGAPFALPLMTVAEAEQTRAIAIIASYWEQAGAQVEQFPVPQAQYRDLQFRASFPALLYAGISVENQNVLNRVTPRLCPTAESRWVGTSLGCYQNPEAQRLIDGISGALEPAEQQQLWRAFVRLVTEDLPVLPMYFRVASTVFREGVSGVKGHTSPQTRGTWNIADWDALSAREA
jgi:peptide/nickel transport system substrate-binding protein